MKYFSLAQIQEALRLLREHHVIFGTTFLALKKEVVPVGSKLQLRLDAANHEFLKHYYRVHPKSERFFRVFRQGPKGKDWTNANYASTGLQSVNTRGRGSKAFEHDTNDVTWGFRPDYVQRLSALLPRGKKVPLFALAVWLYRERRWPGSASRADAVREIIKEYHLNEEELRVLFETEIKSALTEAEAFQTTPVKWHELLRDYSSPEDVAPERSGILKYLETENVGPAKHLRFEPARRLNIITGDNGLGKTFLLDLAWWALTQDWAERPAFPSPSTHSEAKISFVVGAGTSDRPVRARFSSKDFNWHTETSPPAMSGLVVYARVDGSFAVWDPANPALAGAPGSQRWPGLKFSRDEVWKGKENQIEGLLRDWVRWQAQPDQYPAFRTFQAVLRRVSPPDIGLLEIGEPQRIPYEVKPIPTLVHPYATVPIVYESAGIKRIVTFAYLIVWAWEEHRIQAKQWSRKEERQMVVILDEAEAHLHPKWQRVILPALLGIASDLHAELSLQLLVATHSPLVLASSEPVFDDETDNLFHLDMSANGKVSFRALPFEIRGTIDSWLTSPLFALNQPGSPEREQAIKDALRLQEQQTPKKEDVEQVTQRLREFLAAEDPFWVRWVFFAEKHGVAV